MSMGDWDDNPKWPADYERLIVHEEPKKRDWISIGLIVFVAICGVGFVVTSAYLIGEIAGAHG